VSRRSLRLVINPSVPELDGRAASRQPDSSAVEFGNARAGESAGGCGVPEVSAGARLPEITLEQ
jgi:hypothetical protein